MNVEVPQGAQAVSVGPQSSAGLDSQVVVSGSLPRRAPVAQRIEHLTTDQKVGGSNPSGCATITPSQPPFLRSASIRARCRRALGASVGAIGLQQHLGHPGCGCALLAFYEMPVHVFCDGDARVSENLRDHIEIGALGQHQRRS